MSRMLYVYMCVTGHHLHQGNFDVSFNFSTGSIFNEFQAVFSEVRMYCVYYIMLSHIHIEYKKATIDVTEFEKH